MNRSLSSAIDVSSTNSTDSSAARPHPFVVEHGLRERAPARDVDGDVRLLVGDEHLGPALVATDAAWAGRIVEVGASLDAASDRS